MLVRTRSSAFFRTIPFSCPMGTGPFSRTKAFGAWSWPSRMSRAMPVLPHWASMAGYRVNFNLRRYVSGWWRNPQQILVLISECWMDCQLPRKTQKSSPCIIYQQASIDSIISYSSGLLSFKQWRSPRRYARRQPQDWTHHTIMHKTLHKDRQG